jgi:hypothetical protein
LVDFKQKGLKIGATPKNGHLSQRYVFLHLLFLQFDIVVFSMQHFFLAFFSMHSFFQFDITIFFVQTLFFGNLGYFLEKNLTILWSVTMKVSPNKMHL